ncbi:MAG: glutathionylspermidine synthase family protein [Bacteroidetes bacterium]|nr:glutathionylspermidine synthase family protein [Bacteroidota bacterium]
MIREKLIPRPHWQQQVEELGFSFHTLNGIPYWDESACYKFTAEQIIFLEASSKEIYSLCLKAVRKILDENLFEHFHIPEEYIYLVKKSWEENFPSIYGRFDLWWNGNLREPPKLLEFNADTPTSLFEASIVQWQWQKELHPQKDQFNSIHEKLIAQWKRLKKKFHAQPLYFSCLDEFPEDYVTASYLQDCASEAGIETEFISLPEIGWNGNYFTDTFENRIYNLFKLYPWEWLVNEDFGIHLHESDTVWLEPMWKMLLSNKAILALLWKLFPRHPNLLECYFDEPHSMKNFVIKPLLSREGANIKIVENGNLLEETAGDYGEEGFIYQQLCKLPEHDGNFPVIGSWVIGGKPAGIGIREASSLVTNNTSRFLPHYFI